jgi:dephospho-CoA kinase
VIVAGLTGGIATGKSLVGSMLRDEGIPVFDADQTARDIVEPGKPAWEDIVKTFGEGVLAADRTLDRAKLAAIVFSDAEKRKALEAITHPRIREAIAKNILDVAMKGGDVAVVDAALMIETGWAKDFAGVIVVDVPADVQLARLKARDKVAEADAKKRIAAQMPLAEKRKHATWVIENSGTKEETRAQVKALAAALREKAKA